MTGPIYRLLTVAALAIAMSPATAFAQTPSASIDPQTFRSALEGVEVAGVKAPASSTAVKAGMTRGGKIALGAAIGAGAGLFIGEVWFGQQLDFPHGPDMLLGAGIFAVTGALIARALAGNPSNTPAAPKKTITIAPVLSKSTKALVVRLSLK